MDQEGGTNFEFSRPRVLFLLSFFLHLCYQVTEHNAKLSYHTTTTVDGNTALVVNMHPQNGNGGIVGHNPGAVAQSNWLAREQRKLARVCCDGLIFINKNFGTITVRCQLCVPCLC